MTTRTEEVRLVAHGPSGPSRPLSAAAVGGLDADAAAALIAPGRGRASGQRERFVLLGVTVDEVPTDPILVRARRDGVWSPWFELPFVADEAPDGGTGGAPGVHSQPVWVGPSDAYEVDAPIGVPRPRVHLVQEEDAATELRAVSAATAAAAAPSIQPRSAWGARPPTSTPTIAPGLKLAIVHHSVGGNTYSAAEVPSVLRAIQAYHQDVQGWSDFAYNFAVDRFGRTWEGRAGGIKQVVVGGHSSGFNTGSVGVVVLGDFTSASAPSSATEAVANLISWKFALHHVYPASTVAFTTVTGSAKYPPGTTVTLPRVIGHRDVQSTSCPGNGLYGRLGWIRSRVEQLWPGHRANTLGRDTVGVWQGNTVTRTNSPSGAGASLQEEFGSPGDEIIVGDWNGDGWDTLGARRGTQFVVTDRLDGAGPYRSASYGLVTDKAVVGDWDGNGTDTVGVRRGTVYHLRNSITSGPAEVTFSYGRASDVPVFGDWDGNVTETPGIRRGNAYYLRNSNTSGSANLTFAYGKATDVPVTGDWDGDGIDTPGVRRGTSFLLRNANSTGTADIAFSYGSTAARPLAGDWDDQ